MPDIKVGIGYDSRQMNLELFEQMDAPELRSYIEFFLRHYRVMDAFWIALFR